MNKILLMAINVRYSRGKDTPQGAPVARHIQSAKKSNDEALKFSPNRNLKTAC